MIADVVIDVVGDADDAETPSSEANEGRDPLLTEVSPWQKKTRILLINVH